MRRQATPDPADQQLQIHRTSAKEAAILMLLAIGVGLAGGGLAVALNTSVHGATDYHRTTSTLRPRRGRLPR